MEKACANAGCIWGPDHPAQESVRLFSCLAGWIGWTCQHHSAISPERCPSSMGFLVLRAGWYDSAMTGVSNAMRSAAASCFLK